MSMGRVNRNTIAVSDESDVILAGRRVESLLNESAFDERSIQDVVLVVHELASNIVKHAGTGTIEFTVESDDDRAAVEIQASDSGPGIDDVNQAVVDGYSTVGSLGGGLGSVHRLMDDVVVRTNGSPKSGVKIVATRRCPAQTAVDRAPPIEIDAATRPQPGYDVNGDAFLIEHGADWTLVGVIDGLGHGPPAHRASSTAREYLQSNSTRALEDLFAGVEACRATRGVVLFLARFDWNAREINLGSVGNIAVKVCGSPRRHLVPQRGVIGGRAPSPAIDRWDLHPKMVMVVHTDGIASNWQCEDFDWDVDTEKGSAADRLLRQCSNPDDDATALVIRGTGR